MKTVCLYVQLKSFRITAVKKPDPVALTAIMRSIKDIFETYGELVPRMPKELINSIMCQNDPYKLFENII